MKKFSIELKKTAAAKLQKLPSSVRTRIVKALRELEDSLFPAGKKVKPFVGRPKTYRLRVGDYRLVFTVEGRLITVLDVFHRKDLDKFD